MNTQLTPTGPAGLLAARYLKSLAIGKGSTRAAAAYAEGQAQWAGRATVVAGLKAAVNPITTASGGTALLGPVALDFAAAVAPLTVIGRLPGVRRAPLMTRIATSIDAATAYWHGEALSLPVTADALLGDILRAAPVTAVAVVTSELVRLASSTADLMLSSALTGASARAIDAALLDPANAGIPNAKPAALVYGATPIVASGLTPAAVDTALQAGIEALTAAGSDLAYAVWVGSPTTTTRLAGVRGSGGAAAYPGIGARGGELLGLPAITSRFMPAGQLQLIDGGAVVLGDDGESDLSLAEHATVEMRSDPLDNASAVQTSLWQADLVAMKAVRYIGWKLAVPGRAQLVTGLA